MTTAAVSAIIEPLRIADDMVPSRSHTLRICSRQVVLIPIRRADQLAIGLTVRHLLQILEGYFCIPLCWSGAQDCRESHTKAMDAVGQVFFDANSWIFSRLNLPFAPHPDSPTG